MFAWYFGVESHGLEVIDDRHEDVVDESAVYLENLVVVSDGVIVD